MYEEPISVIKSAGFVIFRSKEGDDIEKCEFLLLQDARRSHHWTPPKGEDLKLLELKHNNDIVSKVTWMEVKITWLQLSGRQKKRLE